MIGKVGYWLLLGAVLSSLNLHLALLQLVAWSGMLADYQQEAGSLREAVEMTFGGDYPCELCTTVAEALPTSDDAAEPSLKTAGKDLLLAPAARQRLVVPNGHELAVAEPIRVGPKLMDHPEGPPPRV